MAIGACSKPRLSIYLEVKVKVKITDINKKANLVRFFVIRFFVVHFYSIYE